MAQIKPTLINNFCIEPYKVNETESVLYDISYSFHF